MRKRRKKERMRKSNRGNNNGVKKSQNKGGDDIRGELNFKGVGEVKHRVHGPQEDKTASENQ